MVELVLPCGLTSLRSVVAPLAVDRAQVSPALGVRSSSVLMVELMLPSWLVVEALLGGGTPLVAVDRV